MRITFLYSVILYIKSPRLSEYSLSEPLAVILDKVVALYFGLIVVLLPPENHLR